MRAPEIRPAGPADAETLAGLIADYMADRFPEHPGTPADVLRRDVLGGAAGPRVLLAEREGAAIGFVAWDRIYDLHWAKAGVLVGGLYVARPHRGRGVALALIAALCAEARRGGAVYLHGASYDRSSPTGRLYERIAVGWDSAECTCAGKAFRTLADLAGSPPRALARSLPPKEWNYLP